MKNAYVAYWKAHGAPATLTYADLAAACADTDKSAAKPMWQRYPFAAAFGQHGIHFFTTHDSDNAFAQANADEIVGQQWRFSVPMAQPENVAQEYGNNVSAKLVGFAASYTPGAATATAPPQPSPTATPSGTASPTATPTASATATPSEDESASPPPGSTGSPRSPSRPAGPIPLTVTMDRTEIVPTEAVAVTVKGSPNQRVQLFAYSRPSQTYGLVRDSRLDTGGQVTFRVTPGGNTRLFATYGNGNSATDSPSQVIQVHTTLSLSATRVGVRQYDFHGRNLPRRPGQLITLYRVANGQEIRTAAVRTDSTGTWHFVRTFTGGGGYTFVARTSQTMDNDKGRSNNLFVDIH